MNRACAVKVKERTAGKVDAPLCTEMSRAGGAWFWRIRGQEKEDVIFREKRAPFQVPGEHLCWPPEGPCGSQAEAKTTQPRAAFHLQNRKAHGASRDHLRTSARLSLCLLHSFAAPLEFTRGATASLPPTSKGWCQNGRNLWAPHQRERLDTSIHASLSSKLRI